MHCCLKRCSVAESFLFQWTIPNYREVDGRHRVKEWLKSDPFFLEDGTEWYLRLYPKGDCASSTTPEGAYVALFLCRKTKGIARKLERLFSVVKRDGSQSVLRRHASDTYSDEVDNWGSGHLVKRDVLLEGDSVYLQADGSLHLRCKVTADCAAAVAPLSKVSRLRFSGTDSDFTIFSLEERSTRLERFMYCNGVFLRHVTIGGAVRVRG